jgi:hypothetical protein
MRQIDENGDRFAQLAVEHQCVGEVGAYAVVFGAQTGRPDKTFDAAVGRRASGRVNFARVGPRRRPSLDGSVARLFYTILLDVRLDVRLSRASLQLCGLIAKRSSRSLKLRPLFQ